MRCLILACLLAFHGFSVQAQSDFIYVDKASVAIPSPLPSLVAYEKHSASDVLHRDFSEASYSRSLQPGPLGSWHKIRLINRGENAIRRYLVFDVHILRELDIYLFDKKQLIKKAALGLNALADSPSIETYTAPHVVFSVPAKSQLTLLIYKQNNGPGIFPARILNEAQWQREHSEKRFFWGAIIAVLIAMALYNVLVYAMHPNKSYAWYLLFHTLCFLYFSGLNGFGFHLWPLDMQIFLAQNIMAMNFILIILVVNFANHFLFAYQNAPKHQQLVLPTTIVAGVGLAASLILPEYQMVLPFTVFQIFASIFGMSIGIAAVRSGFIPGKYFLLSWAFTLLGAGIGMATVLNILPSNFFTLHAFLFGTLGELFLLSIGLASRMKYFEMRLLSQSYLYPDTNLGNLSYFSQQLPREMPKILDTHKHLYLVLVNMHGFREVVSLYGPRALTDSYKKRTKELEEFLEQENWSVRFELPSGKHVYALALPGEQILLMVNVQHHEQMDTIADQLKQHSNRDLPIRNINMPMSSHIGFVHIDGRHSLQEQYRKAQVALQHAISKKLSVKSYSSLLDTEIGERITLIQRLNNAISKDELHIHLQPQFDLSDNTLIGAEVLVRWPQKDGKAIPPGVFIPLAEQAGLIYKISKIMIEKSFAWLSDIKQSHPVLYQNFNLSINLSALDMAQTSLLAFLQNNLFYYNLDASKVTLEITESAIMENHELFMQGIQQLQTLGFHLSIDDFGTGYSSMLYLKELQATEIKVDMGFIRNIHQNRVNQKIVQAIVQLANGTGSRTVAEGIECEAEAQWLRNAGCDIAQGYYWNPALPLEAFYDSYIATKL